ncbi:MAG: helix-turn-helix domain-containing protein, partial [Clostridiales bacterium]|nr:helix-turn-helix domain-containing protein [Clostridiales bacterium]
RRETGVIFKFLIRREKVMKTRSVREYPDILSVLDVMDILRIGRVAVYQFIQEKKLAACKIAGKYRIPKSGVIKIIREIENDSCYNADSEGSDALTERSAINEHTVI